MALAISIPLLDKIIQFIVNPFISLMVGLALFFFVWGVVQYIYKADNETERANGRRHMIWGIIGLFIIVAVLGFLNLIRATVAQIGQ